MVLCNFSHVDSGVVQPNEMVPTEIMGNVHDLSRYALFFNHVFSDIVHDPTYCTVPSYARKIQLVLYPVMRGDAEKADTFVMETPRKSLQNLAYVKYFFISDWRL